MSATPSVTPTPPPSPRAPRLRRLFLQALAAFFGVVAGVVVFCYGLENFRGGREWAKEREALLARGVAIDLDRYIPAPVPEASNLAQIPLLRPLFEYRTSAEGTRWNDTNAANRAMGVFSYHVGWPQKGPHPEAGWIHARKTPLEDWQTAFREVAMKAASRLPDGSWTDRRPISYRLPETPGEPALDVLAALASFDSEFDALSEAVRTRPSVRFAVHYEDGYSALLPHLNALKKATGQFALRATARLAAGRTPEAFEDVRTALRLAEAPRDEPYMISQLVRLAGLDLALQPVWEGMTRHAWNEAQLKEMQSILTAIDPFPAWRRSMDLERAMAIRTTEAMAGSRAERRKYAAMFEDFAKGGVGMMSPGMETYFLFAPRGWLYAGLAETSRCFTILGAAQPSQLPGLRAEWETLADDRRTIRGATLQVFLGLGLARQRASENFAKAVRGRAMAQVAAVACAIERLRVAEGSYPETLVALVPRFLVDVPKDPVEGQPLRYTRERKDGYRLASVGESGDWVWRVP